MPDDDAAADDAAAELDDEITDKKTGKKSPREPGQLDRLIAEHIVRLRARLGGLTQEELAARVVPVDTRETWTKLRVQRLENTYRRATVTELAEVITAFGTTPAEFYSEAGIIDLPNDTLSYLKVDLSIDTDDRRDMVRQYGRAQREYKAAQN